MRSGRCGTARSRWSEARKREGRADAGLASGGDRERVCHVKASEVAPSELVCWLRATYGVAQPCGRSLCHRLYYSAPLVLQTRMQKAEPETGITSRPRRRSR